MKIGITGANGFVAWHLRCYLKSLGDSIDEVKLADRKTFADHAVLNDFISGLDLIVHLAGVNRASDDDLREGNLEPAKQLRDALISNGSKVTVLYASTTHAVNPASAYGKAKNDVSDIFRNWSTQTDNNFINLIIPHVFGEYGKPFYNSGVATFCYQFTHHQEPEVNPDGLLELVHVQNLVTLMLELYEKGIQGDYHVEGLSISVPEVVSRLRSFKQQYLELHRLPDLSIEFDRNLFNCFRSYINSEDRSIDSQLHSDNRGWLVETVKAGSGGQCFVSSTHPGITRGNHFHLRKVERFFVLQGKAEIKLRKLFHDEIISFILDGAKPAYVDIPTLHTHNITNIGDEELITLFWSDEFYDPENPDTFFEEV